MKERIFSKRSYKSTDSNICCLSDSLIDKCDAIVSLNFPSSSISLIVPSTSGGIFLFKFTYLSNSSVVDLDIALSCLSEESIVSIIWSTSACKKSSFSKKTLIDALFSPSTNTLTVPSGSFNSCSTLATVPKSNRSFFLGSSTEALFWVISIIFLSPFITLSRALTDLSLPTNNGTTIWGKTTISLKGRTGILFMFIMNQKMFYL